MSVASALRIAPRLVVDGGLATQLEALGANLSGDLWSARLLQENPVLIQRAHADFLAAGADVCITASYQTSLPLLHKILGLDERAATQLIASSVAIAHEACKEAMARRGADEKRPPPLVAGSIGPYGACLADGSEYTGAYAATMSVDELRAWHAPRFEILIEAGADILACETIPCRSEVAALCALLGTRPAARAWVSLACSSGSTLTSGELVADVVADIERLDPAGQVEAIGVNCTAPRHIGALVDAIRGQTRRPIVLYPNSGERWDSATGAWLDGTSMRAEDFAELAARRHSSPAPAPAPSIDRRAGRRLPRFVRAMLTCDPPVWQVTQWFTRGASLIGGCCRVGPDFIAAVRRCADAA
jgi:homocysteine S-methyltransferase